MFYGGPATSLTISLKRPISDGCLDLSWRRVSSSALSSTDFYLLWPGHQSSVCAVRVCVCVCPQWELQSHAPQQLFCELFFIVLVTGRGGKERERGALFATAAVLCSMSPSCFHSSVFGSALNEAQEVANNVLHNGAQIVRALSHVCPPLLPVTSRFNATPLFLLLSVPVWQVDNAKVLHYVGAGIAFPTSMLFVCLQSALTYRLAKTQGEYGVAHLRLCMTLLAFAALVLSILPSRRQMAAFEPVKCITTRERDAASPGWIRPLGFQGQRLVFFCSR